MKRWEYKVFRVELPQELLNGPMKTPADIHELGNKINKFVEKKFNELGAEGWEFVFMERESSTVTFKRPVE